VVIGQPGSSLAVYLAVSAMMVIDWRAAWGIVCLIMFAVAVADRLVHGWVADDGLVFSIFLAALAVWGITQMIVRNQQLALAHDEIARLAVAQERTRFARDMHDLLGHSLTVVTVKAELAGRLVSIDPERAEREINDVERLARDALADVRAAVGGYREVSLAKELVNARTALEAAGIEAEVPNALDDVPGDRRELFGWAVREGVTNVLRHSGARHCRIELGPDGFEIVDDGVGPAPTSTGSAGQGTGGAVPTGNGLVGLRERADAAGSRVSVGRATLDGGFRLRVSR
jgi:two-component system sensor histidine kinase DesK